MRDSEVVASIVAGNPEGLAAAYGKYAGDLYGYCQSLLRDPNDAADAVQDTFVIAASKLAGLRDPERLRAWLFAVARNECLHRLKSRCAAAPLQDAPEQADDSVDVGGAAERAETVALVRAAIGGLNDGERDVINQLWHGLDLPEVAAILGVSRNHAHTLFSRARRQLEASVGVLLVGRAGRRDCATLDRLLGDWDGRLTALLRKRVGRHIDRCPVCSDRRRKELTPALLYDMSPAALLAMAALRGGSALRQLAGARDAVPRLASAPTSAPASHLGAAHAAVGRSAHSFGMNGFPKPPHHGFPGVTRLPHLPLAVTTGTAITAVTAAVITLLVPHQPPQHPPDGGLTLGAAPSRSVPASTVRGGPTAARHGGTVSAPGPVSSPAAAPTSSGGPTGASASAPGGPAQPAAATLPSAPVSAPTPAPLAGTPASPSPSAGTPSAGTLALSQTTVLLTPVLGGTLTLTASGGPVSWSIAQPATLAGELSVTPASGTLSAGSSVMVTITVAGVASLDTQLTVQPAGQLVTVLLSAG